MLDRRYLSPTTVSSKGFGVARILSPARRGDPLLARTLSAFQTGALKSVANSFAGAGHDVVLAPGVGLELLSPLALKVEVAAPSPDVTHPLDAREPVYVLRPTTLAGTPVWLGDADAGNGGVPLSEATGIVLCLVGGEHLGEVSCCLVVD